MTAEPASAPADRVYLNGVFFTADAGNSRFLMPGLVDGHMHPREAGATLLKCNLNKVLETVVDGAVVYTTL